MFMCMYTALMFYLKLGEVVLWFWSWIALYFVLIRRGWEQPIKYSNLKKKKLMSFLKAQYSRHLTVEIQSSWFCFMPCSGHSSELRLSNKKLHIFLLPRYCWGPNPQASQEKSQPSVPDSYAVCCAHLLLLLIANFDICFPSYLLSCSHVFSFLAV